MYLESIQTVYSRSVEGYGAEDAVLVARASALLKGERPRAFYREGYTHVQCRERGRSPEFGKKMRKTTAGGCFFGEDKMQARNH